MSARNRVIFFLVLTFGLSSIFYVRIALDAKLHMLPVLGLMWCPGVAAMIVRLATQRNLRGEGWGWGRTRWQLLAYLLPAILATVVYGLTWSTGVGEFSAAGLRKIGPHAPLAAVIVLLATAGMIQGVIFAAGEELGWRGFLVPELARSGRGFTTIALISGGVWSLYHYPVILTADYHSAAPIWFSLIVFSWMIVAASVVFAWLRLKSGSVWTGVILHASHNVFIQEIFDPLTKNRAITPYIVTEFGVGLALAYTIAAVYFWRRRAEVESPAMDSIPLTSEPVAAST